MTEATQEPRRKVSILPKRKERSESPRWGRRLLTLLFWCIQLGLGAIVGVLLFDKLLMPRVVRFGDDVVVPSVSEMAVADAVESLRAAGLEPEVTEGKFSPSVPGGLVLAVSPEDGIRVKTGRRVFLTPSLGIESRVVPELSGMTLRIAKTKLRSVGLETGEIRYAAVGGVRDGEVLATSPGPGEPGPEGGKVEILLSREKAAVPLWMPDFSGRNGVETAAWLEQCGFEVQIEESSFPGDPGEVQRQDPPPGAGVYPGTTIQLVVSKERNEMDEEDSGWRDRFKRRFGR